MQFRLFLLLILIGTNLTISAQEDRDLKDAYRLLEYWLEAQKDFEKLPGISVAVAEDQQVLWSSGFGYSDIASKNESKPSTIYSICSISKLFTSISIMKLKEEGKLRLDDPVSMHLPWFKIKQSYEDSGPITIRGFLTHSAGVPRQSNFPYWSAPDFDFPSMEEIKQQMESMETLYPASTYFQYSNFGMSILGAIIEEISGMSYEDYVNQHILNPLELKDTRPYLPKELLKGQLSTGYSALHRNGERKPLEPFFTEGITAAAGFTSTVEDMAKFASWQFRLLETGGKEILLSSTLKDMQRVHWMDPNWRTSWGLGFSVRNVDGLTVVGHGGSCPGYRSSLSLVPKYKMAYSVMINGGGTNPGKYVEGIAEVLGKAFDVKPKEIPEGVDLEEYAGIYDAQPWGSEELILPWFGNLIYLGLPSNNPQNFTVLKYESKDTFRRVRRDGALGETIVFERDGAGKVVRMLQHQNYTRKIKSIK